MLDEKKLQDITIFEVGDSLQITDYFVIATGLNARHIRTASDHLVRELRQNGVQRAGREGYGDGGWVLVDFDDVVVHLFRAEERRQYDLELLWGDCPRVEWSPETPSAEEPSAASG